MRCIQVPNAVKDDISLVIKKKRSSPCEERSGKRSETSESENKYIWRYKRLIMFNMLAKCGMATQTGQTRGAFWWIIQQRLMVSPCPWPFPQAPPSPYREALDGEKWAQWMCWPSWVPAGSALEERVLWNADATPSSQNLITQYKRIWEFFSCHHKNQVHLSRSSTQRTTEREHHRRAGELLRGAGLNWKGLVWAAYFLLKRREENWETSKNFALVD